MSRGSWRGPGCEMTQDRVGDEEELVHTRRQGDLLGFARRAQALVESTDRGMVFGGDQGRPVQGGANAGAPAPDDAAPAQSAAFAVERGDPDQGSDGLAVELAQFGGE